MTKNLLVTLILLCGMTGFAQTQGAPAPGGSVPAPAADQGTKPPAAPLVAPAAQPTAAGKSSRPTVYIEPQQGFETYLAAALSKKSVPVDVVTDASKATFVLRSAPVDIQKESTGSKVARCLFLYCAGIEDKGTVSVQLIEASTTKALWAYSVNKQRGGKNTQSMAEAVAKHLKEFLKGDEKVESSGSPQ